MMIFLAAFTFFMLVHIGIGRWSRRAFHVDLKLSRGIAALLLSIMGMWGLATYFEMWRFGFLIPNDSESLLLPCVLIVNGHMLADFVWLAIGARYFNSKPRMDLIIHHILVVVASLCAYWLDIGYLVIVVGMSTELMPVTTGLGSLGRVLNSERLEIASMRLRLVVLWLWRLPVWAVILTALGGEVLNDAMRPGIGLAYPIGIAAASFLVVMDLFWSRKSLLALRRVAQDGGLKTSNPPSSTSPSASTSPTA